MSPCFILACEPKELGCKNGEGQSSEVQDQEGFFHFDDRFEDYTITHHVEGRIDSFNTYIICNLPVSEKPEEGEDVTFSG